MSELEGRNVDVARLSQGKPINTTLKVLGVVDDSQVIHYLYKKLQMFVRAATNLKAPDHFDDRELSNLYSLSRCFGVARLLSHKIFS